MNRSLPAALAALASFALLLPAQEPKPAQTQGVRLTYELPIDALQRQLQQQPGRDLEQAITDVVRTMQSRLGRFGKVTRHQASGFTVDVPFADPEVLARVRRRVAIAGRIEMWIVAYEDYEDGKLEIEAETKHLKRWLDLGGRARVQADPKAIERMPRRAGSQIRWVPRIIRPRTQQKIRWNFTFTQMHMPAVPVYDDDDWNGGAVPKAMQGNKDPRLVELVPLNLHAPSFSDRDIDGDGVSLGVGRDGRPAIHYEIVDARKRAYSDWSSNFRGRASAILLDGTLVTAPVFRNRIPGRGILEGNFTLQQAEDLIAILKSNGLPAPPKLLTQSPIPN